MKELKTQMSLTKTNKLGQEIKPGDRVLYIGWQHSQYIGKLLGWTYSGYARIELEDRTYSRAKSKWTGKTYDWYDGRIWVRRPHTHFRNEDGFLIDYETWQKLPYSERYAWKWDAGQLRSEFEEIKLPVIFRGPKGIERLFKFEK